MPDLYLTTQELADTLKVAPDTIRGWRKRGTGPRATLVGGAVRYAWSDVDAWMERDG